MLRRTEAAQRPNPAQTTPATRTSQATTPQARLPPNLDKLHSQPLQPFQPSQAGGPPLSACTSTKNTCSTRVMSATVHHEDYMQLRFLTLLSAQAVCCEMSWSTGTTLDLRFENVPSSAHVLQNVLHHGHYILNISFQPVESSTHVLRM